MRVYTRLHNIRTSQSMYTKSVKLVYNNPANRYVCELGGPSSARQTGQPVGQRESICLTATPQPPCFHFIFFYRESLSPSSKICSFTVRWCRIFILKIVRKKNRHYFMELGLGDWMSHRYWHCMIQDCLTDARVLLKVTTGFKRAIPCLPSTWFQVSWYVNNKCKSGPLSS